jgi:hypothetical protein
VHLRASGAARDERTLPATARPVLVVDGLVDLGRPRRVDRHTWRETTAPLEPATRDGYREALERL